MVIIQSFHYFSNVTCNNIYYNILVGNNIATAFSLAGAFSIIRFRSAPGDPKDIAYVFFTLAVGLTCGMGYIGYAVIFTITLCALMFVLRFIKVCIT